MQVIVDRSGKMLKNRKYKCDRADLRNNTRVGVLNMRRFFCYMGFISDMFVFTRTGGYCYVAWVCWATF